MANENSKISMKNQIVFWSIFVLFSFLFFGMWEYIQTTFYSDPYKTVNQAAWDLLHCTDGDILILTLSLLGSSLLLRKNFLQVNLVKRDYVFVTILGLSYTFLSEYINVFIHQSWTYSSLMPVIPFVHIGVIPLIQWLILPISILYFVKNYLHQGGK